MSRHCKAVSLPRTALAALLVVLLGASSAGADSLEDKRKQVQSAQSRVTAVEQRLATLLRELNSLDDQLSATSARLGLSQLELRESERRIEDTRRAFTTRARRAYMKGRRDQFAVLLKAESLLDFLSFSRILGDSLSADAAAYRDLVAARESVTDEREQVDSQKQVLLDGTRRMEEIRNEIATALQSEQAILNSAQAELDRLLAARRRAASVSPAVEARRSARQRVLDQKLASLLTWLGPATGIEPFMPSHLRPTGIVTNGLTSWYGPGFDGRRASSGATYRMHQMTAASLVLPFGTLLKVTFRSKSVVVVITDRGPYVTGRVLDLSWRAAEALGVSGVKEVRMEIVLPAGPAPPFP